MLRSWLLELVRVFIIVPILKTLEEGANEEPDNLYY